MFCLEDPGARSYDYIMFIYLGIECQVEATSGIRTILLLLSVQKSGKPGDTLDGANPAPVDMVNISFF